MAWKIDGLTILAGSDSTLPSGGWAGGGDRNIEAKVQQQQQQGQQVPSWPGGKKILGKNYHVTPILCTRSGILPQDAF